MNNRLGRFVFLQVFCASLFAILTSVNAHAATFTVNTTADTQDAAPGNGVCGDAGGACSLRAAITEANALAGSDSIMLPAGTYTTTLVSSNEDANVGGDLDITSPLAINGAGEGGTIIQANAASQTANERVVHILAGATSVAISGVTIQNGVFRFAGALPNPQGGGGIRIEGSTANLTLSNSTLTGNYSENRGGGISTNKANLTINGCTFTNNQAGSNVAGSAASGGAIVIDSEDNVGVPGQTASVTSTIINNNRVESSVSNAFGGGITIRALNASVTITGATISNNTSTAFSTFSGFAGGILNQQAALTLNNSSVIFNTASRFHAGIRNLSSTAAPATLNVINTTVASNTSTAADSAGGGITNISGAAFNAIVLIDRSTVSGNSLTGPTSVGGGVLNNSLSTGTASMTIKNSTISGNSAHDAAGVYSDGSAAVCAINFSTIARNSADATNGEGGGVYQDGTLGGSTTISSAIIADNTATVSADVNDLVLSGDYNHIESPAGGFAPAAHDVTGSDPGLGTLQNNGGQTQTHLPGTGLDAISFGTNGCGTSVNIDQRGTPRPGIKTAGCDKGSVEIQGGGTPTGTGTSTPTATSTNTATPTATGTPVSSISGTITYGNAIGAPSPRPVSNVLLSGAGTPNVFTTTDLNGNYVLTGFGGGSYTVSPSKTDGQNSITSFDAGRVAQHVTGTVVLNATQLLVADTSGNGNVTSFDAAQIARYAASAPPYGSAGTWLFVPANRTYGSVSSNITAQDFEALLMGEVSGNWTNSPPRPAQ